jgi:hypothetical protein
VAECGGGVRWQSAVAECGGGVWWRGINIQVMNFQMIAPLKQFQQICQKYAVRSFRQLLLSGL